MTVFPNVFMEIQAEGNLLGRIEFELFANTKRTSYNFMCLCKGKNRLNDGRRYETKKLTYKGNKFHRIIPQFLIQAGDIDKDRGDGTGGDSIYGPVFPDEDFSHKHDKPYTLSMANTGERDCNSSQFFITLVPCPFLDEHFVCFGKVVKGQKVVKKIEGYGVISGEVSKNIIIKNCGVCE